MGECSAEVEREPHLQSLSRYPKQDSPAYTASWNSTQSTHAYLFSFSRADQVEEHLDFMKESLGGWLNVVEVRKRRFVKIIKNTDTHVLAARIESIRKKLLA